MRIGNRPTSKRLVAHCVEPVWILAPSTFVLLPGPLGAGAGPEPLRGGIRMSDVPSLPQGRIEERFKDKRPLYSEGEAVTEANRCIYCVDAPCIKACPTGIDIPTFIHKIATRNILGAARTILEENVLGTSCSRVCPVEVLCVGDCVYNHWGREPIQIGRLQRYATETAISKAPDLLVRHKKKATGKKIACIGAGPASLAAAAHLALEGHEVTLFEKRPLPGGLNATGIAPYKLTSNAALDEVRWLLDQGDINVRCNVEVTRDQDDASHISTKTLDKDFEAVFLGVGLGEDSLLGIPGEDGDDVYGAVALIEKLKLDASFAKEFDANRPTRAFVIGGGNTAIDIAHELAIAGVPEVSMVYRRGRDRMTAYGHELDWGAIDGVTVLNDLVPVAFVRDDSGKLVGLEVADAKDGRAVAGTERVIGCDVAALAIGQARLTQLANAFDGVKLDASGRVIVDDATCRTGNAKVYAGGDCVNGGKEVVNAAQHGKLAARAICVELTG